MRHVFKKQAHGGVKYHPQHFEISRIDTLNGSYHVLVIVLATFLLQEGFGIRPTDQEVGTVFGEGS